MSGFAASDVEVSASECGGDDECGGFDAVRNDAVLGSVKFGNAFDANGRRACTFDAGAHFVEQVSEVGDFGLASAVLHDSFAVGQSGGHEKIFSAGYGDLVENDFCAFEALGASFDVAMFLANGCAETLESFDVQVDRTSADSAATGK